MKRTLENLWTEYLLDSCATIDSEEERIMTKNAVELHEKINAFLNKEQKEVLEKYVDLLSDIDSLFAKKSFLKGCEFTAFFLLEILNI